MVKFPSFHFNFEFLELLMEMGFLLVLGFVDGSWCF